jgi:hypothetical protein
VITGPGPGPENLPAQGPEPFSPVNFAEFVRHALHAAADQVEPGGDGLTPIRARILAGGE